MRWWWRPKTQQCQRTTALHSNSRACKGPRVPNPHDTASEKLYCPYHRSEGKKLLNSTISAWTSSNETCWLTSLKNRISCTSSVSHWFLRALWPQRTSTRVTFNWWDQNGLSTAWHVVPGASSEYHSTRMLLMLGSARGSLRISSTILRWRLYLFMNSKRL